MDDQGGQVSRRAVKRRGGGNFNSTSVIGFIDILSKVVEPIVLLIDLRWGLL